MSKNKKGRSISIISFIFLAVPGMAQLSKKAQEVWPAIDTYYRLNQKFRMYGTLAGTKLNESSYSEGALGLFLDYFTYPPKVMNTVFNNRNDSLPGKFLWLRFGYQYSATPPSEKDPFKESMLVTEANTRAYLPFNMLLTFKNRFDWRIHNGEFKSRYRPRLMLERDLRTEFLTFTASGFLEYYANFGNSAVNKWRTQLGVELRVLKRMNYEIFWNHQFEQLPEVQEVDAFGMTLKFYLDKSYFKEPVFSKKKNKKPIEIK
jgi:Protein of unknown function (DUF2490)